MEYEVPASVNEEPAALTEVKNWITDGGKLSKEVLEQFGELDDPIAAVRSIANAVQHAEDKEAAGNRFMVLLIQTSAHAID
jgi:hypothetical protein